ncbi:hypothetical protein YC2023_117992 [Brassica napus]
MMVFLGRRHQRWRKKIHEVRSNGNRGFLIWYIKSVTRSYHSRSWKSELAGSCYDQKNGPMLLEPRTEAPPAALLPVGPKRLANKPK